MSTSSITLGKIPPQTSHVPLQDGVRHPRAWLSLGILFLFVLISYIDRMALVLLVDPIKHDVGITDLQISYLQGLAFAICFGLAGPPLGWVADRYSPQRVIFAGVVVWSLATAASGLTLSYPLLFAARFLVGVGEAALMPAGFVLLAELFPRRQHTLAFGILAAGAAVGGSVAVSGGGYLAQAATHVAAPTVPLLGVIRPWQLVFLVVGLPGLLLAPLVFLVPSARRRDAAQAAGPSPRLLPWLRKHIFFVVCFSLAISVEGAMAYGVTNWTPTFFQRFYNVGLSGFAYRLGTIQLVAGLIGYVMGGHLADVMARKGLGNAPYWYLMGATMILLVAGLGAFGLRAGPGYTLAFLALFHLVLPYTAIVAAELHLAAPRALRAQVIATVSAVYTIIGMAAGPSSVAFLTEHVFGDPKLVGNSLTLATVIFCPLGLLFLAVSLRAASRAIAAARSEGDGDAISSDLI